MPPPARLYVAVSSMGTVAGLAITALYADLDAGRLQGPTLYWHTFNAHGRPPGVVPLPAQALSRYVFPA